MDRIGARESQRFRVTSRKGGQNSAVSLLVPEETTDPLDWSVVLRSAETSTSREILAQHRRVEDRFSFGCYGGAGWAWEVVDGSMDGLVGLSPTLKSARKPPSLGGCMSGRMGDRSLERSNEDEARKRERERRPCDAS